MYEICSKLTIKTQKRRQSLLLTMDAFYTFFRMFQLQDFEHMLIKFEQYFC